VPTSLPDASKTSCRPLAAQFSVASETPTGDAPGPSDAQVTADVRRGMGSAFVRIAADRAGTALAAVRAVLESARKTASAVVLAAPPEIANGIDVWGVRPPDFFLMKRIKEALDPESLFASGGFVGGL